jgi:uncharacterized protein
MNKTDWIERYELSPHPEGGYYREVYRSPDIVTLNRGQRSAMTNIFYLLGADDFSSWHRILSDETWAHLQGNADLCIHMINEQGEYSSHILGKSNESAIPLFTVPAKVWFAVETISPENDTNNNHFALVSCTVAPGFHWEDFTMAEREELTTQFPLHEGLIAKFTRVTSTDC